MVNCTKDFLGILLGLEKFERLGKPDRFNLSSLRPPFPEVLQCACDVNAPRPAQEKGEEAPSAQALPAIPRHDRGSKNHPLALKMRASAQVHIFEKEEEPLIEPLKLIEEILAEKEARPHHPICVADGSIRHIRLQVVPKPLAENMLQECPLDQDIEERGERPRGLAHPSIGIRQFRRENADGRIRPEHLHHALHTRRLQLVIGIDDQQILAAGKSRRVVVARTVSAIAVGFEQPDMRMMAKMRPQRADAVILGMVVDDQNFNVARNGLLQKRPHALHCILR